MMHHLLTKTLRAGAILLVLSILLVGASAVNAQNPSAETYQFLAPLPFDEPTVNQGTFSNYLNGLFKFGLGLAVVLAIIMIVIGGVQYMSTDSVSNKKDGLQHVNAALGGLLLAIFAWLILRTINPAFLNTELAIDTIEFRNDEALEVVLPGEQRTASQQYNQELDRQLQEVNKTLKEIQADEATLRGATVELVQLNDELSVLKALDEPTDAQKKRIETIETRIPELEKPLASQKENIAIVTKKNADLTAELKTLEAKTNPTIDDEIRIKVIEGSLIETKQTLSGLENGFDRIQRSIAAALERIDVHLSRVIFLTSNGASTNNLNDALTAQRTIIAATDSAVAELRSLGADAKADELFAARAQAWNTANDKINYRTRCRNDYVYIASQSIGGTPQRIACK